LKIFIWVKLHFYENYLSVENHTDMKDF